MYRLAEDPIRDFQLRLRSLPCKPRPKGRVLSRGQAQLENLDEPLQVARVKRLGVEPEAREDFRAKNAVGARQQWLEPVIASDKPVNLVGLDRDDHILAHACALVIDLLRTEIESLAGTCDFDNQLWCTGQIAVGVNPGLAA